MNNRRLASAAGTILLLAASLARAQVPPPASAPGAGVTAIFAASGDLGNFSGYAQGSPDYERLINIVHDAAIGAGVRLCGPRPIARPEAGTC